jgi:adenosylmethionine-8-amino-7-oxononanoate aminotransferase
LHSHSYTGNALACRAAPATPQLFEPSDVLKQNRARAAAVSEATAHLAEHPNVADVRQTGMIMAIELAKHRDTREPLPGQERRGLRVYQHGLRNGALLRPLGNVVYFIPPYVITEQQIQTMTRVGWEGILCAVQD